MAVIKIMKRKETEKIPAASFRKRARKSKCPVRAWTNSVADQFRQSSCQDVEPVRAWTNTVADQFRQSSCQDAGKRKKTKKNPATSSRKRPRKSKCRASAWMNSVADQLRHSSCQDAGLRVENSCLPRQEAAPSENKMSKNVRYELIKVGERKFKLIRKKAAVN